MSAAIEVWLDFKSPYAWLALEGIRALGRDSGRPLSWRPFCLDVAPLPATADAVARAHEARKLRYLADDVARLAARQGKRVVLPEKPVDSRPALLGGFRALEAGCFDAYADLVFDAFFAGRLRLDDVAAIADCLAGSGAPDPGFADHVRRHGPALLAAAEEAAEAAGVFGSPTLVLDGELFWGGDRLEMLRRRLSV